MSKKKDTARTRVSVMFSRRFDSKSRNGQIWSWIKHKYPDNSWHEPLLELAYIFFSALAEAEHSIQDRTVQNKAIANFSAFLARTIEQKPFLESMIDLMTPELKQETAIVVGDAADDDDFKFEDEDE